MPNQFDNDIDELSDMNTALGHPIRLQIIQLLLAKGECQCGDLVKTLPLSQSTISQHLKKLKAAGFIKGRVEPPKICYCLNLERLQHYLDLTHQILTKQE